MYTDFKGEFLELFGELSLEKLWLLVKFSKNIRLRCRNNTAFNNFMNATFPYASFRQIEKQRPDGTTYPGLKIIVDQVESEEEETVEV